MDVDQKKGYDDQELLLRAITTFTCTKINRSERIISGLMRQSINEWSDKTGKSVKEIKHLEENERLKAVTELIDIFTEKVKHIMDSKSLRDRYKADIINIYEKWKKTRRTSP